MFENYDEIITIAELCEIFGIGRSAAYKILHVGDIKAFRIGRIWKILKRRVEEYIQRKSKLKNTSYKLHQ